MRINRDKARKPRRVRRLDRTARQPKCRPTGKNLSAASPSRSWPSVSHKAACWARAHNAGTPPSLRPRSATHEWVLGLQVAERIAKHSLTGNIVAGGGSVTVSGGRNTTEALRTVFQFRRLGGNYALRRLGGNYALAYVWCKPLQTFFFRSPAALLGQIIGPCGKHGPDLIFNINMCFLIEKEEQTTPKKKQNPPQANTIKAKPEEKHYKHT